VLNVLNKIDVASEFATRDFEGVAISARDGRNLDLLRERVADIVYPGDREVELLVPYAALRSLSLFRAKERVEILEYVPDGVRVRGRLSEEEVASAQAVGSAVISPASPAGRE
jgi:50S ribosomal subunit-associated GTPase HflX